MMGKEPGLGKDHYSDFRYVEFNVPLEYPKDMSRSS